jgi:DNA-binding response OmpR family regulator
LFSRDSTGSDTAKLGEILIVEDDYLVAMQMEDALREAGFDVVGIAVSADQAIALASSYHPVLAVMDIRLAGKRDGIDAAVEIFRDYGIRCIFATAHADEKSRDRAIAAAPLDWIQKPYNMESLVACVRKSLRGLKDES